MKSQINEEMIYVYIGRKIKDFREQSEISEEKVTQEKLAIGIGVSRVSVANYENGKQAIYLSDLYKIADFLNVEISAFLPPLNLVKLSTPEEKLRDATDLTPTEKDAIQSFIGSITTERDKT